MSITADHILDALVSASSDKIWATEVPFRGSTTRIDFWTLEPTKSAGFRATSYEIKVSRADYKRDSEEKQAGAIMHSDRFFYVTPPNLLTKADIPPWAGLMEWDGKVWRIIKRPPKLEKAAEPGWGLLVDILRNSGQCRRDVAILTMRIQMAERQSRQNAGSHAFGFSRYSRMNQRFAYRYMNEDGQSQTIQEINRQNQRKVPVRPISDGQSATQENVNGADHDKA